MSSRLILVTRPKDQASLFAEDVRRLGGEPVICPLLNIKPVFAHLPAGDSFSGVVVTSRQIFSLGLDLSSYHHLPLYCVGEASADDAEKDGFPHVISAKGDVASLVEVMRRDLPKKSSLLYLRGEDVRADLAALLPEDSIEERIVYKAEPLSSLPQEIIDIFPRLHSICLFSPRTGVILSELIQKHDLEKHLGGINLLCLSHAVLESVSGFSWKSFHVCDLPDAGSMRSSLAKLF